MNSESEEDLLAIFAFKSMVAYFKDLKCNNPIEDEDDGEWVINENVTFDYPVSVDLFKSVDEPSYICPCPF